MFAYQELHDKDNLTRAICLVMNNLDKITHVAQACSVSPQSIYREINAIQEEDQLVCMEGVLFLLINKNLNL